MDSRSRMPNQNESRESDNGEILRRIEEKLDRLLGRREDDWHTPEWAPSDAPFAPYGPGGPRPGFIDVPRADAGPRFVGTHGVDFNASSDDPLASPVAARSSAREYYLLMEARGQRSGGDAAGSYEDYRRRMRAELDREYADYCRDRQACFDRDFGAWRDKRREPAPPLTEPARQETAEKHKAEGH